MTPRDRLIELAAAQLLRNGNDITPANAHECIEHICYHNSTVAAYYFATTQQGLTRLINATVKRANQYSKYAKKGN